MNCKVEFERWQKENPDATIEDAWVAGWMQCTNSWCHGKRKKLEKIVQLISEIIK